MLTRKQETEIIYEIINNNDGKIDYISLVSKFRNKMYELNEICIEEPLGNLISDMLNEKYLFYKNGYYMLGKQ